MQCAVGVKEAVQALPDAKLRDFRMTYTERQTNAYRISCTLGMLPWPKVALL